jgi:putative transposase
MKRQSRQLELRPKAWGGRRDGAGRKPNIGRRNVPHVRRPLHESRCPVHVTLRASADVPSLRSERFLVPIQGALRAGTTARFRVLEFSIQADHLHLLVEANGQTGFERGVRGLAIRIARLMNRLCGRRGAVWADRYHARLLRTPREVRNALVYVLNNFKKHIRAARGLDPYSSAQWFTGWRLTLRASDEASPVACAETWLARVGWRKGGLIGVDESPGRPAPSCRKLNVGPAAADESSYPMVFRAPTPACSEPAPGERATRCQSHRRGRPGKYPQPNRRMSAQG